LRYAQWGIDYLKYDWCNTEGLKAEGAYKTITAALRKAGRPIVLSICEWGNSKPWEWGAAVGHLWRTTGDIYPCFNCIEDHGSWKSWGVMRTLAMQENLRQYAGPGHWNDPDMLEVGNGMKLNEDRAHFSMWAMVAAPLIAGNDLRSMAPETLNILENKEVIAIDQDSLGIQGFKYSSQDSLEIWLKPLKGGDWAVCFLNKGNSEVPVTFDWKKEVISDTLSRRVLNASVDNYRVRDLWTRKTVGSTRAPLKGGVPSHDVWMLRLEKE